MFYQAFESQRGLNTAQQIQVRKRKLLKINVGWLLFKQSCTNMPIKYFIWYVIVAGWQETFRSAASRLAGDFWVCASRLAADLKVSCQPAGRRPRLTCSCHSLWIHCYWFIHVIDSCKCLIHVLTWKALKCNNVSIFLMYSIIIVQICHDVGGNFNIHIWAYSGDFIFRNRWTDNFVLM